MMDISRVARANTPERRGSSAGACCRKNGTTSAPSRPRAAPNLEIYQNFIKKIDDFLKKFRKILLFFGQNRCFSHRF